MTRLFAQALTIGFVAVGTFGGSVPTTHAATRAPAFTLSGYAATLLAPRNGTRVIGAVALVGGPTVTTISLQASGLRPLSANPVRINISPCGSASRSATYVLPSLTANAGGDAAEVATLRMTVVPANGFSLAVLAGGSLLTQACGNLHRPSYVVQLAAMRPGLNAIAMMTEPAPVLSPTLAPVQGTEVVVAATGLIPGVANPAHIHANVCGPTSGILIPLNDLVADGLGRAVAGTGIAGQVPFGGLSLHIHNPASPAFSMIGCGNI